MQPDSATPPKKCGAQHLDSGHKVLYAVGQTALAMRGGCAGCCCADGNMPSGVPKEPPPFKRVASQLRDLHGLWQKRWWSSMMKGRGNCTPASLAAVQAAPRAQATLTRREQVLPVCRPCMRPACAGCTVRPFPCSHDSWADSRASGAPRTSAPRLGKGGGVIHRNKHADRSCACPVLRAHPHASGLWKARLLPRAPEPDAKGPPKPLCHVC